MGDVPICDQEKSPHSAVPGEAAALEVGFFLTRGIPAPSGCSLAIVRESVDVGTAGCLDFSVPLHL